MKNVSAGQVNGLLSSSKQHHSSADERRYSHNEAEAWSSEHGPGVTDHGKACDEVLGVVGVDWARRHQDRVVGQVSFERRLEREVFAIGERSVAELESLVNVGGFPRVCAITGDEGYVDADHLHECPHVTELASKPEVECYVRTCQTALRSS